MNARTISTKEDLNALPYNTAVLDSGYDLHQRGLNGHWYEPGWEDPSIVDLPARVIYTPGDPA